MLILKEKMFGIGESFEYFRCNACNCIQISEIPEDLSHYYPQNYYSFRPPQKRTIRKHVKIFRNALFSKILGGFYETTIFTDYGLSYADRKKSILDIGSGNGVMLRNLSELGFKHLTGIDPFLSKEIRSKKFKLLKQEIQDITGEFDIVMSHHSLEHMQDPHKFFAVVSQRLKDGGRLILRIPIFPNYIWDNFSVDWIQLDPPRHLYTFSIKGIEILCDMAGLSIKEISYDGQPWSYAATEYCQDGRTYEDFKANIKIESHHITECDFANQSKNGDSVCLTISKKLYA